MRAAAPSPRETERNQAVSADAAVPLADTARANAARSATVPAASALFEQQEVVAERVRLDQRDRHYLRQKASRCQPKRRTRRAAAR